MEVFLRERAGRAIVAVSLGHFVWSGQFSVVHLVEDLYYHRDVRQLEACSVGCLSDCAVDGLYPASLSWFTRWFAILTGVERNGNDLLVAVSSILHHAFYQLI